MKPYLIPSEITRSVKSMCIDKKQYSRYFHMLDQLNNSVELVDVNNLPTDGSELQFENSSAKMFKDIEETLVLPQLPSFTEHSHRITRPRTLRKLKKQTFSEFSEKAVKYYRSVTKNGLQRIPSSRLKLDKLSSFEYKYRLSSNYVFEGNDVKFILESARITVDDGNKCYLLRIPFNLALFFSSLSKKDFIQLIVENFEFGDEISIDWKKTERAVIFNELNENTVKLGNLKQFSFFWNKMDKTLGIKLKLPRFVMKFNGVEVIKKNLEWEYLGKLEKLDFNKFDYILFGELFEFRSIRKAVHSLFKGKTVKINLSAKAEESPIDQATEIKFVNSIGNQPFFVSLSFAEFSVKVHEWDKVFVFSLNYGETRKILNFSSELTSLESYFRKKLTFDLIKKELHLDKAFLWQVNENKVQKETHFTLEQPSSMPKISTRLILPTVEINNFPRGRVFNKRYVVDEESMNLIKNRQIHLEPWRINIESASRNKTVIHKQKLFRSSSLIEKLKKKGLIRK